MQLEGMPAIIMTVVVCLIMLAVGTFAFMVTTNEINLDNEQTQDFRVTDPTVAKRCVLDYTPETILSVQKYDGFMWTDVSSSYYSVSGNVVTVEPGGMS